MTKSYSFWTDNETYIASHLCDHRSGDMIRLATQSEEDASIKAAKIDGGHGIILIDGRRCFVC